MNAEDFIRHRHHPVDERCLFQISNTVKSCGDPVFRGQHVAGDLRLDRVHIVHEPGRAGDVEEENQGGNQNYEPTPSRTSTIGIVSRGSWDANSIFHRFIQINKTIRPHK